MRAAGSARACSSQRPAHVARLPLADDGRVTRRLPPGSSRRLLVAATDSVRLERHRGLDHGDAGDGPLSTGSATCAAGALRRRACRSCSVAAPGAVEVGPGQTLATLAAPASGPVARAPGRSTRCRTPGSRGDDGVVRSRPLGRLWLPESASTGRACTPAPGSVASPPRLPVRAPRYWADDAEAGRPREPVEKEPDIADWFYLPRGSTRSHPLRAGLLPPPPGRRG